jgi:ABC-type bacteriocin/lantibiotic exporter with double-glycine peptidase domain
LKGNITLNNVSFQFDAHSPLALKNINLEIPHGKKVAIIGESGSGKSTLISLLNGLFEPTQGTIYYDKYNMADLDKKLLRSQLGIVTQNHILFNQTIRENISLGNPDLDYSDIIISAQLAEIHDDIMKMPMQYETIISENGTNLSGGQKQRLSIARALINQPKILILDEATSALDTVTEEKVDANISSMNCTRIVVAHRLSTIINSDMVVILKDGQIVANGTHKQLEKNPEYLKFFKKQQRDEFDT